MTPADEIRRLLAMEDAKPGTVPAEHVLHLRAALRASDALELVAELRNVVFPLHLAQEQRDRLDAAVDALAEWVHRESE